MHQAQEMPLPQTKTQPEQIPQAESKPPPEAKAHPEQVSQRGAKAQRKKATSAPSFAYSEVRNLLKEGEAMAKRTEIFLQENGYLAPPPATNAQPEQIGHAETNAEL